MERLVANVKDDALKSRLTSAHMKKGLPQLRDEVAALPVVNATPAGGFDRFADLRPQPIYVGAAGAGGNPTAPPKKSEPIPTINIDWSKPVERTPSTPTGTTTAK